MKLHGAVVVSLLAILAGCDPAQPDGETPPPVGQAPPPDSPAVSGDTSAAAQYLFSSGVELVNCPGVGNAPASERVMQPGQDNPPLIYQGIAQLDVPGDAITTAVRLVMEAPASPWLEVDITAFDPTTGREIPDFQFGPAAAQLTLRTTRCPTVPPDGQIYQVDGTVVDDPTTTPGQGFFTAPVEHLSVFLLGYP